MGLEQDTGTLEPGKRAGFAVLGPDPLLNIANIRHVRSVASG
mgnify:CR=1 FL=1